MPADPDAASDSPITVVMLTRPGREDWAARAAASFNEQTADAQLLVCLVGPDGSSNTPAVPANGLLSYFPVVSPGGPAAALRHAVGVAQAAGGYFALWDDDDWYHPLRLARQVAASKAKGGAACFLSSAAYHFPGSGELFVVDLERQHHSLQVRVIPSTLLCPVGLLNAEVHPAAALAGWPGGGLSSLSPTDRFARAVLGKADAARPEGEWCWMVKTVADDSAGYEGHRRAATDVAKGKPAAWLVERRGLIGHWLDQYAWDGPLEVCGPDGVGFGYEPARRWPTSLPKPAVRAAVWGTAGGPQGLLTS